MFAFFDGRLNFLISFFLLLFPVPNDISLLFDSALSRISISIEFAVSQEDKKPDIICTTNVNEWIADLA